MKTMITPDGGSLILITLLALALVCWRKGALGEHVADTGRVIEHFMPFERAAHWANAGAFVVLATSGLVMAFGKFFLLPLLGGTLFGGPDYLRADLQMAHLVHSVANALMMVIFSLHI